MTLLARLGLAALGVLAALLVLELGLRLLYPHVPIIERHAGLGTRGRPNLDVRKAFGGHERVVRVATNADGLRGPGLPSAKAPGTRRLLALGDSFTFGAAVEQEEAWPWRLQELLNRSCPGRRYEVVNAGMSGYGTGQARLLYSSLEQRLRPDVAILGLSVVNDLLDDLCIEEASSRPKTTAPCFTLEDDRLSLTPPAAPAPTPSAGWRPRPRVIDFMLGQAKRLTVWHPGLLTLVGRTGYRPALPYMPATVASWYDPQYSEPGWRLTRHLLRDLRDHLAARDVPFVVLVIPASLQVDFGLQAALRLLGEGQPAVRAFFDEPTRPQRLVGEFCREAGLECVDPLPALLEAERAGTRTYYAMDQHWMPAAHALAAEAVARRLRDRGLAPPMHTAGPGG
jgi:hypothetical protein